MAGCAGIDPEPVKQRTAETAHVLRVHVDHFEFWAFTGHLELDEEVGSGQRLDHVSHPVRRRTQFGQLHLHLAGLERGAAKQVQLVGALQKGVRDF